MTKGKYYYSRTCEQMVKCANVNRSGKCTIVNDSGISHIVDNADLEDINIFFMDDSNAHVNNYGTKYYVPDWDQMIKTASCTEEAEMIKEAAYIYGKYNDGFHFSICFTIFTRCYTIETGWCEKWTIYQFPWYTENGKEIPKNEMINCIIKEVKK